MLKNQKYVYGDLNTKVPVKLNFGDFILQKLWEKKNNTAIINAATHVLSTYGEIAQEAMNVAVSLCRLGVGKGDVVAISSENCQEFLGAVIGVACTGAVTTTINTSYAPDELEHVMNISKPKYIFCSTIAYEVNKNTFKSNKYVKKIVLFGNKRQNNTLLYKDLAKTPNNWLKNDVSFSEFEAVDVQGQIDTLFILYSSGTTGLPKGVMITHLNVIALLCSAFDPSIHVERENVIAFNIAPWVHGMGLLVSLGNFSMGVLMVYLPYFDMELYLDAIQKYTVTRLVVVPTLLVALCKWESKHDVSSVTEIFSSTAPLHRDTLGDVRNRFPNLQAVFQAYGLTECTISKDSGDVNQAKLGSVGKIFGGVIVKVVDIKTQEPLGPYQLGEICVKGATVMKGYVGKNRKDYFDDEGFFKTGDIGYYDEDRYFFVVDRLKELIKYKGYQVPPVEIESLLLKHEAVQDVGVVGMEDKVGGEIPVAFVVTQPGKTVTEEELKEFVAKRLSPHKHLRGGVRFIDEIPRNLSGKMLRRELRKMLKISKSKL